MTGWLDAAAEIAPLLRHATGDGGGGESGVLQELFAHLPEQAGYAVEFDSRSIGAATVRQLVAERGWDALYMDRETAMPQATTIGSEGGTTTLARENVSPATINELFSKHGVPANLGCLLIDIDGLDWWVWRAIDERYSPALVIVEFNAHVAPGIAASIAPDDQWVYARTKDYGASLAAFEGLAKLKGYRLIHIHGCWNLYFIREDLSLPESLEIRTPLTAAELELVTDTDSFYDSLCGGARPSWTGAVAPDVSRSPWQILADEQESIEVDLEGLCVDVLADNNDASWYRQRKTFEEKASLMYPLIAERGFENFVEIGANIGLISILARRSNPSIRSIAIEPDPDLVRLLRVNFARHGLSDAEIVTAIAGSEEAAERDFSLNERSSLDNRVSADGWPTVRVPMTRVDALLRMLEVSGSTFFKVDTQGYERQVLEGLEGWLESSEGWMLKMEFAPNWLRSQGTDPLALLRYIQERWELVEFPARLRFGTRSLEALFSEPIGSERLEDLLAHTIALDKQARGWIDLLVRPRV